MEKAHDISLDEPCVAHQAILFMLDVLMRNNKPTLTLDELYDSFGDKSFTPQMLRAVGGNEQGLKQFLLRYPSLFTVNGDLISANSGGSQLPRISTTPERYLRKSTRSKPSGSAANSTNSNGATTDTDTNTSSSTDLTNSILSSSSSTSSSSSNTPSSNGSTEQPPTDSKTMKEIEQEAIAFFRKQISKREEDWLPIVSVAGHASQSSSDVRKFVGPQNEFKSFLLKYPHIFVVREEYCGLKGKADVSTAPFPPPSPPPKRRIPTSVSIVGNALVGSNGATVLTRNHSFKNTNRYSACGNLMPNAASAAASLTTSLINPIVNVGGGVGGGPGLLNPAGNPNAVNLNGAPGMNMNKPRLTPVEVKAVHYVMRILHKNGRMLLQTIPGLISRAPDQVSNIVGFTREDLIQFFKRHSAIFQLHPDGCVSVKQDAVKALILKDVSNSQNGNGLSSINGANNPNINGGTTLGSPDSSPGIITNNGVVLRIFPKYGILNMDNNEQVFFDIQSCQFETFSDLTTILHTGDRLYFNAIIGPRDGSTKWRSLKTWIKMKPQQSSSNNNMLGILDNMSSHSDADKSDDSSTSSSHGGYSRHHHHQNHYLNGNSYNNQQLLYNQHLQQQQQQNSYYMISGGNMGVNSNSQTPTGLVPSSPTSLNGNNPILNGSIVSPSLEDGILINNSSSNSLNSLGTAGLVNSASTGVISGGIMTASVNGSGDFNQYQLDSSGDFNPTTNSSNGSGATDENNCNLESTMSSSSLCSNLIHSSSANNLPSLQNNNNNNNNNNTSSSSTSSSVTTPAASASPKLNDTTNSNEKNQLTTSKSIHSFNLASTSELSSEKKPVTASASADSSSANNPVLTTKFMKQSADNISQRETNNEKVSIGCQTISTGDITVTNVYIE